MPSKCGMIGSRACRQPTSYTRKLNVTFKKYLNLTYTSDVSGGASKRLETDGGSPTVVSHMES